MGGSSNYLITASRLGLWVGVADCIGDDDLGAFYRTGLEAEGVDTSRHQTLGRVEELRAALSCLQAGVGTPTSASKGVSGTYTPEELDESYIWEAALLHESVTLSRRIRSAGAVMKAIRTAKRAGGHVFFDPSPVADAIKGELLREAVAVNRHSYPQRQGAEAHRLHARLKPEPGSLLDLGTKQCRPEDEELDGCSIPHTIGGRCTTPGSR